jgi:hypothetical protein
VGAASYLEDDLTRFFEATEPLPIFGPPGHPRHHCPFCKETFEDRHLLSKHLSAKHHGNRPVLLINGREPDRIATIRQALQREQIAVENCSMVRVCLNGIRQDDASPQGVPELLSHETDATIILELINRFDETAKPIHESYRLTLRVPDKGSVDQVDRAFIEHLATGTPHMSRVAAFLDDRRCRGVVSDYADALGKYIRGILVKEQAVGTGVTLRPAEADELYGGALEGLKDFQRPLPIVVCGLIRFAFNDFSFVGQPTGFWRLDRCNSVFARLLNLGARRVIEVPQRKVGTVIGLCPFDQAIDRILDLAERLGRQSRWGPTLLENCRQAADAQTLSGRDRVKVHALWAATALRLGADEAALEALRQLWATYPFGPWAAGQLDRMEDERYGKK